MSTPVPSYRDQPPKLLGGVVCLDFVNTVSWRGDPGDLGERLTSYAELLAWAVHAGVLDASGVRKLAAEAKRHPQAALAVLDSAIELREALARILVRGRRGAAADLAIVNARLAAAPPRSAIHAIGSGFAWGKSDALADPLHPVLWSAADLLTSGQFSNVRACGDARCRWLFLDPSPSGRRRWCSMKECGNRSKARRHYEAKSRSATGRSRTGARR